jgi:cytoskeletal protein CcmA (bactofilin family)
MIRRRGETEEPASRGPDERGLRSDDHEGARSPGAPGIDRTEARMADNGEVTIVGAGARLEGNVVSAGNLRIDGQVKGQINAEGDVALSPQSQVEADIRAQNVSVAGRFTGNIQVKGKAHLARGGRIDGNITSKTLVVEEGGVFHGQSIMDGAGGGAQASGGQKAERSGERQGDAEVKVP